MNLTWFRNGRERILAIGWRLAGYEVFCWVYNYPLYIWTMTHFGLFLGWFMMTILSLVVGAYMFWRYDRKGVDWLFANTAREWEDATSDTSGWFRRALVKVSKSRNSGLVGLVTFVLASINADPLIVAVHYRKQHFNGLGRRDWGILVATVAIANLWWGPRIVVVVWGLKILRHML